MNEFDRFDEVNPFDQFDKPPPSSLPPGVGEAATAVRRGVMGLHGLPGDLQQLYEAGTSWLANQFRDQPGDPSKLKFPQDMTTSAEFNRRAVAAGMPDVNAPPGIPRYAQQALEGATMGAPFGVAGLLLGALSGGAAEAAGHATEGTPYEPYARAGAGIAAPTAAGVARGLLMGSPRAARETVGLLTPDQSEAIIALRQAAPSGTMPTVPEAIAQVAGPNRLQNVQRVVEQSSRGGPVMAQTLNARPAANAAAVDEMIGTISPPVAAPTEIAPRVQRATGQAVDRTRQAVNQRAEPFYKQAEAASDAERTLGSVPVPIQNALADPTVQAAIKATRADPLKGAKLSDFPDNDIRVLNEAKKYADGKAEAARGPNGNPQEVAEWTAVSKKLKTAGDDAFDAYREARRIGAEGRRKEVEPLKRSATGQLAEADTFAKQRSVLFPRDPDTLNEAAVTRAVSEVVKRDPEAAKQLVRQYLESEFAKATRDVVSRDPAMGGARFRAMIEGNTQQAKNLRAAIEALPGGQSMRKGFDNLMTVFEAQGQRLPANSATSGNLQIIEDLKGGSLDPKILQRMKEKLEQWRYGQNTRELAAMFIDPDTATILRRLAVYRPENPKAKALAIGLLEQLPRDSQQ